MLIVLFVLDTLYLYGNYSKEKKERIKIASDIFDCACEVPWFIVQILMLIIFSKYGKPLEDDDEKLIKTKMIELFEKRENDKNDEKLIFERK